MDTDDDLAAATAARSVQILTAISMLTENLVRARQQRLHQQADREYAATRQVRADSLAAHAAARTVYGVTNERGWTIRAGIVDAARVWRAAHDWSPRDAEAARAQQRAEAVLRDRSPAAMAHYDVVRARGGSALEAMSAAAHLFVATDCQPTELAAQATTREPRSAFTADQATAEPTPADVAQHAYRDGRPGVTATRGAVSAAVHRPASTPTPQHPRAL